MSIYCAVLHRKLLKLGVMYLLPVLTSRFNSRLETLLLMNKEIKMGKVLNQTYSTSDRLAAARIITDDECSLLQWDNFVLINRIIFTIVLTGLLSYCLERLFTFRA